jgi:outer membrane protein OmpA-like peptidoglycan-associated protein
MSLPSGILRPAESAPPSQPQAAVGRKSFLWAVIGLVVALAGLFFWLRRLELQLDRVSAQVEQANQKVEQAEGKSEVALHQASQAEASARQAAQQRDLAEQAKARSEKEADSARELARQAHNEATLAEQKAEEFRKQREDELARLQQVLGQIAETRRTAMGLIMTLGSNSVRFDFDKSDLRPENREVLSRIAGVLTALKGYNIYVYGYTDDVGTQDYNKKLSERRARAVRDYLVQAGLDPNIITAKGYGKADPRVAGDSSNARAINRRVEIGIVDSRLRFDEVPPRG